MPRLTIPFIQYMRPDGRKVPKEIDLEDPDGRLSATVAKCHASGCRFEAEVLSDEATCSFTITHERLGDLFITLCQNGPEVLEAISLMIMEAEQDLDDVLAHAEDIQ